MLYKGYSIEGDGTFGMKVIKFPGRGGGLPKCLEGSYTKAVDAQYAIDFYLARKQEQEEIEAAKPEPIKKVKLYPREVKTNDAESTSGD
jgi:hypothetical protein